MVNMPYADKAVSLAREKGFADRVGLHLNLSQGNPLTDAIKEFPYFCNDDGSFNKKFHHRFGSRFFLSFAERVAVGAEIKAQLDRFCAYGGLLPKLDSHHHVHTDWSIYQILEQMALEHGFTLMRISATLHKVGPITRFYKKLLNRRIACRFETTDHFDGFNPQLVTAVERGQKVELMTHPMYSSRGEILDMKRDYREIVEALHV